MKLSEEEYSEYRKWLVSRLQADDRIRPPGHPSGSHHYRQSFKESIKEFRRAKKK